MTQTYDTPHLTFHYLGPGFSKPAKTALYLALSAEDSLSTNPFFYPAKLLAAKGWRVISATPPCHEHRQRPENIAALWQTHVEDLEKWINAANEGLSYLLEEIKGPLFAVSLSRGFILTSHLAAKQPNIKALLGFAPLTKLPKTDKLNTKYLAPLMAEKKTRIYIGHADPVVSTENVIHLTSTWIEQAKELDISNPEIDLVIKPSIGTDGHSTHRKTFEEGIDWLCNLS